MTDGKQGPDTDETRPQKGGEAGTTRFGMEEGDNTDVPATGIDPEQQSPEIAANGARNQDD
jgi:hypothetical protein